MTLQAIDLFAGAGGLTLGLESAGVETRYAVEIEAYRAQTFAEHFPTAEVLCTDVTTLDLRTFRGKVDLVCGGPPCQPFSSGGLRGAEEDERDMMPSFVKAVDLMRPAAFLMENVPGLAVGGRGRYLNQIVQALGALGYNVSWQLLSAADYGVPQKRKRLFVVGMRDGWFRFPEPTHGPRRALPHVAVKDALPTHQTGVPNRATVTYAKSPDLRPNPYHGQLFNGGGRPIDKNEPAPTILASAGGNKTHFFDELDLVPDYHRHLSSGGTPRVGTLPGARRLTVAESALLQTFPREIAFRGPQSAQYQQVGNAVPPVLAAALGRALVPQVLHGGEKRPVHALMETQPSLFEERKPYVGTGETL